MDIAKMSSSANQPVCVGRSVRRRDSRIHMKPRPAEPSRYLTVPPVIDVRAERADVELERADGLVAVRQEERAGRVRELGHRRHVVPVTRPEGHGRAADERGPLVDLGGEALERDAPVVLGADVDDLGAAELLRVRDLPDRRELVLADDDAVPLAREVESGHERADSLRDRGGDGDVVGRGVQEPGERGSRGLVPLDPEVPLGPVLVPARDPALHRVADALRERALRARVRVDRVLEDRELVPADSQCRHRVDPDAHLRPRYALRSSSCWMSSDALPSSTTRPVERT